jgi:hypothetical protein
MLDSGAVSGRPSAPGGASPARRYAAIAGALLVVAGVVGAASGAGAVGSGGWQDALHIVTGALGLVAVGAAARDYALGIGLLYALLGIAGLAAGAGTDLLGELPVTVASSLLHLALGLVGLGAGAATPAAPARAKARARARA